MRTFTQHLVGNTPRSCAGSGSSLPQDVVPHGQGAGFTLSSHALKLIACATMLVDHVGFLFFPGQLVWRIIGRISFPLFAFLIAEGYEQTSNLRAYFFRLLALAAISQLPFSLVNTAAHESPELNIFFTLAAGLVALYAWDRFPLASAIPAVGMLLGASYIFSFDYGMYGVISVLVSRLILHHKKAGITVLLLLHQLPVLIHFAIGSLSIQTYAALSVPFIAAYDGKRGKKLPKSFFYLFYPVHLLILWFIWFLLKN